MKDIPCGRHRIRAEYHSSLYKTALLILGTGTLGVRLIFGYGLPESPQA
jgi:hypothetical protein